MRVYVAVYIGCLHCGEDSRVLLVTEDRSKAEVAIARADEDRRKSPGGDQYSLEIFESELTPT